MRRAAQRTEWEALDDEEKEKRRIEAIHVHECRRAAEERHEALSKANLADPSLPVLVYDLSFAWCMSEADTKSTVSQLKFSYSTLRSEAFPFRPAITSLTGTEPQADQSTEVQARVLQSLSSYAGFSKYPPLISEQHWSTLYPKEKVVFLTADAGAVLEFIERNTIYIIGAFVDHNHHKGLSCGRADAHGVRTMRIPIAESIDLGNRCKVLTINHLTSVLAAFVRPPPAERSWTAALEEVLPTRRMHQEVLGSRKRRRQQAASVGDQGTTS